MVANRRDTDRHADQQLFAGNRPRLYLVPMALDDHFGRLIAKIRKQRRWRQKDAAKHIGVSENYLGRLERSREFPGATLELLWRLCEHLGTTPQETVRLFELAGGDQIAFLRWALVMTSAYEESGAPLPLEVHVERDGTLDSEAKQAMKSNLRAHRARMREEQTAAPHPLPAEAEGGA